MNSKVQSIVNGECDMRYYSIRMKLDDFIKDKKKEQVILENIQRCSKLVGTYFQVVFWHENLTEKDCKNFVKRNEKLLFEVNSKITKEYGDVWFLIDSINEKSIFRYKCKSDILTGIAEYLKIINHMKNRDGV